MTCAKAVSLLLDRDTAKMHIRILRLQCCGLMVTALVCMVLGQSGSAGVVIQKVAGNIQGDVLLISVNRSPYGKEGLLVSSAQDCEDQCTLTSGCSGWSYCSKAGGCGSGCREYHKKVGATPLPNAFGCTPYGVAMPMLSDEYRPGGIFSNYKPDPQACTASNGWPQHTCTLKTNVAASPSVFANGVKEGWQSGTVSLPPSCQGGIIPGFPMTAYECSVCLKDGDPRCLSCSKDLFKDACAYSRGVYVKQTKAEAINSMYASSCLPCTCYGRGAAVRSKCFEAVKSIGIYTAKDYSTVGTTLATAAKQCPSKPAITAGR